MLVAAAVCPHTPLIVRDLDELRSAARAAVAALRSAAPDLLVVVGGAEETRRYAGSAAGTLRPWGLDVTAGAGEPVLPLSLTIGRWLLDADHQDHQDDPDGPGAFQSVAFDAAPADCLALGAALAEEGRVGLLVLADGSACLAAGAPGRYDDAARPYNDAIARAVAEGDPRALAGLDAADADRLWVGGRAALQVLAGAAAGRRFSGRLLAESSPYGVGYFAGSWT
ncbi:hypothetical protein [Nonomuraea pusilla]|uniref:Catalytic LigB subunit of aromatic ring-opening dioxygenase n=1 Tax=Nonomuraea pusilla TaxID=46177 RepID=A0A1H7S8J8_9ACTN|nr:hypothetical protein [Nonomuraea pusilla]SEL68064.1 hypothetical protein SAMN05660976_03067 [Nonomuraea pusilla]